MSTDENTFKRGEWHGDQWQPSDDDDADGLPVRPGGAGIAEADLELLELAARAIGAVRVEVVEGENWVNLHFEGGPTIFSWNSLVHGDDTLHLAVVLDIDVKPSGAWEEGMPLAVARKGADILMLEPHGSDALAATKRAVTRAAAEIGKRML